MKALRTSLMMVALAATLATAGASNAAAQSGSDSEDLLSAIAEQDSNKVIDLITRNGSGIINARGYSGETPLTVAMRKRADTYVNYLLQHGADANLGDKNGDTGLMIAARLGYGEGVTSMFIARATVDATNRQGETALIIAVQGRYAPIVKRLLEAGASPSHTDNASGLSARDYAVRDRRSSEILKLIEQVKKKPVFVAGPIIR